MTIGSVKTGPYSVGSKLHYAKAWSGVDGKLTPGPVPSDKWNAYSMATSRFRSSNPNQIGTVNPTTGVYSLRTNHSWAGTGGDPGTMGYAAFGDGSISSAFPTSQFNALWSSRDELALLEKMSKKVKGHDLDLGVSLAEVDKFAGTILATVKNLCYGVNDLRRFRFESFARRFGAGPPRKNASRRLSTLDISGRFLEMRYAWSPAIQDAFEVSKAFEALSRGPRKKRFRAHIRRGRSLNWQTNYCQTKVAVDVRRSYLYEMSEELGFFRSLGLADPRTVLWERLPWSFVIDWFVPIGTYLSVIGQVPHMKGRWLRSSSYRCTFAGQVQSSGSWNPASPYPSANWERFFYERTSSFSPPTVPFPSFKVAGAVQGKRLQNALALAHQLYFRRKGHVDTWLPDHNNYVRL